MEGFCSLGDNNEGKNKQKAKLDKQTNKQKAMITLVDKV